MSDKSTMLKISEGMHLEVVNSMCLESLSPDTFIKWEEVVKELVLARTRIKGVNLEGHSK